jgi:hypothetical protein
MSRIPFDQFSKQYLADLLAPLGQVETSLEVPGEARFVDIWFSPSPQPAIPPEQLGLLGRIALTACLIEPFRNQPSLTEIRNCLLKLFLVQADRQRQARRDEERLTESDLPKLWMLTSSASDTLLQDIGATAEACPQAGIYSLAKVCNTMVIAINQLPATDDTLWLRILGKGQTQQEAINQVLALPKDDPQRSQILRLLASWKIRIEVTSELDDEDQELLMTLSQAYLEWEQATEQRGLQRGLQQGVRLERRVTLENLLRVRFGELDEQLHGVIQRLIGLSPEDYATQIPLLLTLSRHDLVAHIQQQLTNGRNNPQSAEQSGSMPS